MGNREKAIGFFTGIEQMDAVAATMDFKEDATYLGITHDGDRVVRKLYDGRKAMRAYFGGWIAQGIPLKYTYKNILQNQNIVMIEWTDEGRDKDGNVYRNQGVNVFEFNAAGKITCCRSYYDWAPLQPIKYTGND